MPKWTRSNPVWWKSRMLKGVEPERQSSPVLYHEPHKRRMTKNFDFVQPRGYVEDVEADSQDSFRPIVSNETECRTFCALANHQHLRKRKDKTLIASLDYRASLRQFNLCGNCFKPIRIKRDKINHGVDVDELTATTVEYADIPAHYEVRSKPTANGKRTKYYYELVSKTRIFNQKCGCGII